MNIPTYVINLERRPDRKIHILNEFKNRSEFQLNIIEGHEHQIGAIGLWNTIIHILSNLVDDSEDYILICEDDHHFTEHYTEKTLADSIYTAKQMNADILLGGISSVHSAFRVSKSLCWVEKFTGLQFTIIFRKFIKTILEADFYYFDAADYKLSSLTNHKFFLYPFISVQIDTGYSDATSSNNKFEIVPNLFRKSETIVQLLINIKTSFESKNSNINSPSEIQSNYDDIVIPTYIINLPERTDRLAHIYKQFEGRQEFDITIISAIKHEIGALGLWLTIRSIIQTGVENEDDVLIICEDDHEFTKAYSREFLIRNIIEAHGQDVDVLSGGIGGGVTHAIPIGNDRFWVNHFYSTQFVIIFKKLFSKILSEPYDNNVTADDILSELSMNKMVTFPFISIQKYFGYSDVTNLNNNNPGYVESLFSNASLRLETIRQCYLEFKDDN